MAKHKFATHRHCALAWLLMASACTQQGGSGSASKTLPPPGQDRLTQVFIFWDPNEPGLSLPWAAPNPEFFIGDFAASSGIEARIIVESSSDPKILEERVRDWNSRPHDLIIVGANPAFLQTLQNLNLPTSNATGAHIFLTSSKHVQMPPSTGSKGWQVIGINEGPAFEFLKNLCHAKLPKSGQGCQFSDSSAKRTALQALPKGSLSVQFADISDSNPAGSASQNQAASLSISIAWDVIIRAGLKRKSDPFGRVRLEQLQFSDGTLRVKVARNTDPSIVEAVKLQSLKTLLANGADPAGP